MTRLVFCGLKKQQDPDQFTCEDTRIALGAFVASVKESKRTQLVPVFQ